MRPASGVSSLSVQRFVDIPIARVSMAGMAADEELLRHSLAPPLESQAILGSLGLRRAETEARSG